LGVESRFHRRVFPEIVVAPSLRHSSPHNANCKCTWRKDFRSAWRDGHGISRYFNHDRETTECVRILCGRLSLECQRPLLTGDSIGACDAVTWGCHNLPVSDESLGKHSSPRGFLLRAQELIAPNLLRQAP
jgi:hypothetical protein